MLLARKACVQLSTAVILPILDGGQCLTAAQPGRKMQGCSKSFQVSGAALLPVELPFYLRKLKVCNTVDAKFKSNRHKALNLVKGPNKH